MSQYVIMLGAASSFRFVKLIYRYNIKIAPLKVDHIFYHKLYNWISYIT